MSITLMSQVWTTDLPVTERIVLLALADRADDDGMCWPAVATVAAKCGLSDRSVQRAMKRLAVDGHLTRAERLGKGTIYTVHPRQPVTPGTESRVTEKAQTPDTVSPNTSRYTNPSDAKASSERARDPKPEKPKRKSKAKREPFVRPDHIPAEPWSEFERMRARKHPLTDHARKLIVKDLDELAEHGFPPGDVLDQSTKNGWRGVFAIKKNDDRLQNNGEAGAAARRQALYDQADRYAGQGAAR